MKVKRLVYYLIINIIVSASVVLGLLWLWERRQKLPPAVTQLAGLPSLPAAAGLTPAVPDGEALQVTTVYITLTVPTASPLPPSPTPLIFSYVVQAGDTLSGIAVKFDTSMGDIMKLNNLSDPNTITEGMTLLIPRPGALDTATPTVTLPPPTPTPTPKLYTDTPAPPTQAPEMLISAVIGAGDLATERVELKLTGDAPLALAGWQLKDENDNVFNFPALTLYPGGQVAVYTKAGQASVNALYWNLSAPVWHTGEVAVLIDAAGNIRAAYQVP